MPMATPREVIASLRLRLQQQIASHTNRLSGRLEPPSMMVDGYQILRRELRRFYSGSVNFQKNLDLGPGRNKKSSIQRYVLCKFYFSPRHLKKLS
jgi:hypothetical protein